ncbi:hypothetical protein B296_00047926 [Ensete ventricosum]|uniref:Uncharacterized protein n=1 Tax=Ensete ventricosum TaxID=4639 RepID=A0A426XG59_ENSVE|nr:hypothetical protein B296_00047926 [Ensete ventricosum]
MSSSGSFSVRVVHSTSSEGTRSEGPEASVSRSSCSGIPSLAYTQSQRDLEVIKSCHDVASVINEEALESIWECYSIPERYVLRAPLPEQRPYQPGPSEISISVDVLEASLRWAIRDMTEMWLVKAGLSPTSRVASRLGKRVKIAVRKHKSHHDEESSRQVAREKESEALVKDSSPTYRRSRLMKDLCGMRVRKDDEGYYVLPMADWAPRDLSAEMQARWPNLSYLAKVGDDPEAASEFNWGVLHPTLAKYLYTLPLEILMAQVAKQIALGHHYQMALLDRVYDVGHLVTHMGNRASLLEAKIKKSKIEGYLEQLATARRHVDELQADNAKLRSRLDELTSRLEQADEELNELRAGLAESQR